MRYSLAASLSLERMKDTRRLLRDALQAVDAVLDTHPAKRGMRVTLLEGERVGALALSIVLSYALRRSTEGDIVDLETSLAKNELLDIGHRFVKGLRHSECEVLYGRAGYLGALAFVRAGTGDNMFGMNLARDLVGAIVMEGERVARAHSKGLPLLWEWHGKTYLGAIHGVAGILFTLLCFYEEVSLIEGAVEKIKDTITKLGDMCFASGNLRSSIGSERDKLVHLCHGAPGHILLLVKAYEVFDEPQYLESAERIATNVLCCRGLLKKGVGLCHGIAGSAYCFLALHRARRKAMAQSNSIAATTDGKWLSWAHHFAKFAAGHVRELYSVPDRPCSLYEGAAGLVMLLHDLKRPDDARFPCFEPPVCA